MTEPPLSVIHRFSSRRQRLDRSFLAERLRNARAYDRIAGYFSSSLLELVGEELDSVSGPIRVICNSDLDPLDVQTAKAARDAVWQSWTDSRPETLQQGEGAPRVRQHFERLYRLLQDGKLQVRVLPDEAFGLIHGKAGVITVADGSQTCFVGSANESKSAWQPPIQRLDLRHVPAEGACRFQLQAGHSDGPKQRLVRRCGRSLTDAGRHVTVCVALHTFAWRRTWGFVPLLFYICCTRLHQAAT